MRDPIIVEPARRTPESCGARFRRGRRSSEITFRAQGVPLLPLDDPFVPLALLVGLRQRRPVRIEGPVSTALLASLPTVTDNLLTWYPALRRVDVTARSPVPPAPRVGRGVACFFSGGLDSFYSVLRPPREVTHLLFVHGFDLRLEDVALRAAVAPRVRDAAAGLDATLLEIETDLRRWSDPHADWTWYCHAGLVATALLVSHALDEIRIAATIADAHRPPALRGGARRTWDNGGARIVSDGAEATRPGKARVVAASPAARRHLRVCWENRDGRYNCGACPKCLRTRLALEVVGVRGAFPDFAGPLDLEAVATLPAVRRSDRQMLEECLWEAQGRPDLEPVAAAMRAALSRGERGGVGRWLRRVARLGRARRRRPG